MNLRNLNVAPRSLLCLGFFASYREGVVQERAARGRGEVDGWGLGEWAAFAHEQ